MTIEPQSRINFSVSSLIKKTALPNDAAGIFDKITADDGNVFYKFVNDTFPLPPPPPQKPIINGKLIHMPIPQNFLSEKGTPIHDLTTPLLFPLLIDLGSGPAAKGVYEHFCHDIGVSAEQGTACAQFLQVPSGIDDKKILSDNVGDNIVYFKTENTQLPKIKGNPLLNFMVQLHEGENLWYLPTITPNKTVIYVVFESEYAVKKYIRKNAVGEGYFLGLNGFIIYVDDWDCSIFFHDQVVDVKKIKADLTVTSSAKKKGKKA